MSSARTALRERVAALGRARRAFDAGRLDDAQRVLQDELARWPGNRDAQVLLNEITRARGETPGHAPATAPPLPARRAGADAWSSFEQRIRERKATRLRDSVRAALDAGSAGAALQALEELDAVAPGIPLPEDIVERLRAQHLDEHPRQDVERVRESVRAPGAAVDSAPAPSSEAPAIRVADRAPVDADVETPGYLLDQAPAERGVRELMRGEASPGTVVPPVIPPSPPAPRSALDLFPPASEPAGDFAVDLRAPFDELPLRQRELEPGTSTPSDIPSGGSMRLRLAPAAENETARSTPPLRERGAHLLGLLLVVSSILALSGWAGYRLFKPTTAITEAPNPEISTPQATGDARDAAASAPPPPQVPDSQQAAIPPVGPATGTAGGDSTPAVPGGTVTPVPPAAAQGAAPVASAPESPPVASASSSLPDRVGTPSPQPSPATPTVVPTVTNERARSSSSPSVPVDPRAQGGSAQTTASGGDPGGLPSDRSPQPTPEPVPSVAQGTSEPPTVTTEPASPAPTRESAREDTGAPGAPAENDAPAAAETGTSARDADAMRGLIEGYLAGYNNLDAGGVRAVWPSVDQRGLSRAFGQLRSQHLSFSRCEVRTTGDAGHGFCTGHAAWRPRVGGGEKIEQRIWRFDFAQRADDWIIQKVSVER